MAFNVTFYQFAKRENSTKQPLIDTPSRGFSCTLKNDSNVINPSIQLKVPLDDNLSNYNYCYIPNFNRYYYITDWECGLPLWTAHLTVDALATFKNDIGAKDLYILRSSYEYNGRIVDKYYPTLEGSVFQRSLIDNNPWKNTRDGCYILGVVSKSPDFGSISYYAITPADMRVVVANLLSDSFLTANGFSAEDATLALQKSLVDPLQYIKSAVFMPISYNDIVGSVESDIDIFNWSIDIPCKKLSNLSIFWSSGSIEVDIPKHPQAGTRGSYLNTSPFTNYELVYPPFGVIPLDSTILSNQEKLYISCRVDYPSGLGILTLSSGGYLISRLEAQIGVPIQLTQITRDYIGGLSSAASAIGGGLTSLVFGNVGGVISNAITGIGSAVEALTPRSNTIGSGGSFSQLDYHSGLYAQFFLTVPDDNEHNGRPLCSIRKPSSIPGYMLIQDGDIAISGTREEAQAIKNYLESGFYYE